MKISLITTVLNEEKTIDSFLKSVLKQTKIPYEVIIVDGGSTDLTINKIKCFGLKSKVITKKGNRSIGRNEAIRQAKGDIIAIADAGCLLDKNWLRYISLPFKDPNVDVVAGFYKSASSNIFQKSLTPYVLVMPDHIDPKGFLPATRSMALKKSVWKNSGKFDEKLSNNEDYVFARKLKELGANIYFEKKAIVEWIPRANFRSAFYMFYRFSLGDIEAGIIRPKVLLIFARYIFIFFLIFTFIITKFNYLLLMICYMLYLYIIWAIWKNYKYVKDYRAIFFLPALQFTSDLAVLIGSTIGGYKLFLSKY